MQKSASYSELPSPNIKVTFTSSSSA